MKRQAMEVTPKELINIAIDLISELEDLEMSRDAAMEKKCVVNIINREVTSDTWEFE